MSGVDETRFLERIQFFDMQQLFATDLQGLEEFNRRLRWLHNLSLHQYGIGRGLEVYGKKGDRQVVVNPGYAIDVLGREIVLVQPETLPVPPVSDDGSRQPALYELTIAYPEDDQLVTVETRDGICRLPGAVRLRESPEFAWVRVFKDSDGKVHAQDPRLEDDVKAGRKLVLAQAKVLNCQLYEEPAIAIRHSARPAHQPFIACGHEKPVWSLWQVQPGGKANAANTTVTAGLTAHVPTAQAGFVTPPCYMARIEVQGGRPLFVELTQTPIPLRVPAKKRGRAAQKVAARATFVPDFLAIVDGPVYVEKSGSDGFDIHVPVFAQEFSLELMNDTCMSYLPQDQWPAVVDWANDDWSVVWLGVEG